MKISTVRNLIIGFQILLLIMQIVCDLPFLVPICMLAVIQALLGNVKQQAKENEHE